jgi:hypothetical protein
MSVGMKLFCAAVVGAGISLGLGTGAKATTYNWSFTCNFPNICGGSGTLETNVAVGPATVTSITGTIGGSAITAFTAPGNFGGNDNQLLALSPSIELTGNGIAFVALGQWRLYAGTSSDTAVNCAGFLCAVYQGAFTVSDQVAQTPIPGALPLFATGLAGLGFLAHRRKRACQKMAVA